MFGGHVAARDRAERGQTALRRQQIVERAVEAAVFDAEANREQFALIVEQKAHLHLVGDAARTVDHVVAFGEHFARQPARAAPFVGDFLRPLAHGLGSFGAVAPF